MLLDVCLVYPLKRLHEHIVHCGAEVAKEGHEEEGEVEHAVLDEVETMEDLIIPVS